MEKRVRVIVVAILSAPLLGSCGSFQRIAQRSSERLPQTSDPLSSTRGIALTAFRSTVLASIRQPVTTTKVGFSLLYQRSSEVLRSNLTTPDLHSQTLPEIPGTPEFERLLDRRNIRPAETGSLSLRIDGRAFFSDFEREVLNARKSINVQVYIFDNDDVGVRCADLLKRRSTQLSAHVLFDDMGTTFSHAAAPSTPGPAGFVPPGDIEVHLREGSKVKVRRTLNPWLVSDHTKLITFDEERAYLGGMNLGREYRSEWHDLMARVEGPIVRSLDREFNRAWRKAGPWGDIALIRKPILSSLENHGSGPRLRLLRTDPSEGRYDILDATKLAIRASRKRIWVENPYFAADDIKDELIAAAHRGVDVRVILPASGDSPIMDAGNLETAGSLIANGVKVFRYPKMTHMKVMLCDGWGTLGSANLDTLSMRINRELNLSFNDPATIKAVENSVFLPDFKRSRLLRIKETESLLGPIVESIADQL
jgi:cardiolipin synthase